MDTRCNAKGLDLTFTDLLELFSSDLDMIPEGNHCSHQENLTDYLMQAKKSGTLVKQTIPWKFFIAEPNPKRLMLFGGALQNARMRSISL